MYFSNFPITTYQLSKNDRILVTDFIKAVTVDPLLKEDSIYSEVYTVADNETPEIISHKVYGTVAYHWVIMMINEAYDPFNDYPKSDDIIQKRTIDKFGSLEGIHHYEDSEGNIVDGVGVYLNSNIADKILDGANLIEPHYSIFKEKINGRILGDITGNGNLDSNDATYMQNYFDGILTSGDSFNYIEGAFSTVLKSDTVKYGEYLSYIADSNPEAIPITNYEYMTKLNEEKRNIKFLKKEILAEFVKKYSDIIGL